MSPADFIFALVDRVSSLKTLYEEHINFYEEILPHVFMGEVTKYLVASAALLDQGKNVDEALGAFNIILDHLEAGMAGDNKEVREMLAVSFLENLDPTSKQVGYLEKRLGPTLTQELHKMRRS